MCIFCLYILYLNSLLNSNKTFHNLSSDFLCYFDLFVLVVILMTFYCIVIWHHYHIVWQHCHMVPNVCIIILYFIKLCLYFFSIVKGKYNVISYYLYIILIYLLHRLYFVNCCDFGDLFYWSHGIGGVYSNIFYFSSELVYNFHIGFTLFHF